MLNVALIFSLLFSNCICQQGADMSDEDFKLYTEKHPQFDPLNPVFQEFQGEDLSDQELLKLSEKYGEQINKIRDFADRNKDFFKEAFKSSATVATTATLLQYCFKRQNFFGSLVVATSVEIVQKIYNKADDLAKEERLANLEKKIEELQNLRLYVERTEHEAKSYTDWPQKWLTDDAYLFLIKDEAPRYEGHYRKIYYLMDSAFVGDYKPEDQGDKWKRAGRIQRMYLSEFEERQAYKKACENAEKNGKENPSQEEFKKNFEQETKQTNSKETSSNTREGTEYRQREYRTPRATLSMHLRESDD